MANADVSRANLKLMKKPNTKHMIFCELPFHIYTCIGCDLLPHFRINKPILQNHLYKLYMNKNSNVSMVISFSDNFKNYLI